jgi:DNA polymerase-3 subunit delta'
MLFKEVIGQGELKLHLAELVSQNRLSHALLFLGKEGSGALPLAVAFAQYVVCEKVNGKSAGISSGSLFGDEPVAEPVVLMEACGECNACRKASALVHPDIHFSYPVVPKKAGDKPVSTDYIEEWREFINQYPYGNVYDWLQFIGAENKQGNITANECGEIIRKLNLKSFESRYKILIMWMPEYLGNEGNKLLKLIEEPPADTLFILVAENESLILQTILSRTQLVKVPALETSEIQEAMISRAGVNAEQAARVAAVSEGNYREALQTLQHAEEDWNSLLRDWLNAILKTGPIAQVKWVDEVAKLGRERQKQFLRYFNHLLGQAIRIRIIEEYSGTADPGTAATTDMITRSRPGTKSPRPDLAIPDNERDFAGRLNKIAGIAEQQAIIEELDKASYYIERNANAKMLFHALTIKLYHIIADKSLILIS